MAWTFIASTSAASLDALSVTTPAVDTSTADTLFLWTVTDQTGVSNPSDSKSNTYIAVASFLYPAAMKGVWYVAPKAIVGASHTFTNNPSGNFPSIIAFAFKGGYGTNPLDVLGAAGPNDVDTTLPAALLPSVLDALILQGLAFNAAATITISGGGGYAGLIQSNNTANALGSAAAYLIQVGAPVSSQPTWDDGVAGAAMKAMGASWKIPMADAAILDVQASGAAMIGQQWI